MPVRGPGRCRRGLLQRPPTAPCGTDLPATVSEGFGRRKRGLPAGRHADTEVFYMAGKQLAALSRSLVEAGWPGDAPALVVSRAGWPDELASDHAVDTLGLATVLHAGRPTVVIVGAGARALAVSAPPLTLPASRTSGERARKIRV